MEFRIRGRNMDVQPVIKDYATEKIGRLEKYLENQMMSAEIEFIEEKNPSISANQTVEVTLFTKGPLIRASETAVDMHAAIDKVIGKLERQIKRYKDKLYHSSKGHKNAGARQQESTWPEGDTEAKIVKVKQVQLKPMTRSEAAMQMDLLGHTFFIFKDADTESMNVVYKRHDENYGVLEPQ